MHHTLLRVASDSSKAATSNPEGAYNAALIAITFAALGFEAMANTFLDHVIIDWKDFDKLPSLSKMRLIAEKLQISFDPRAEPWCTVRRLMIFRNLIAHPKPQYLVEEHAIDEDKIEARRFEMPETKLEREITAPNAKTYLAAVVAARDLLLASMGEEQRFEVSTDGWTSSTIYPTRVGPAPVQAV